MDAVTGRRLDEDQFQDRGGRPRRSHYTWVACLATQNQFDRSHIKMSER